jgi:hypothetical protein
VRSLGPHCARCDHRATYHERGPCAVHGCGCPWLTVETHPAGAVQLHLVVGLESIGQFSVEPHETVADLVTWILGAHPELCGPGRPSVRVNGAPVATDQRFAVLAEGGTLDVLVEF